MSGSAASTSIRTATAPDIPELAAVSVETYVAAFGYGFRPDELAMYLEATLTPAKWAEYLADGDTLLALDGEKIVGFLQLGPSEDEQGAVEVHRLYVQPGYQGRGIGSDLLAAALETPEVAEATGVFIGVWEENPGAQRLYSRFGFTPVGRRPFTVLSDEVEGYDILLRRPGGR